MGSRLEDWPPGRSEQRCTPRSVVSERRIHARPGIPDRSAPLTADVDGKRVFLEESLSRRSLGESIWHESEVDLGVNARVSKWTRNHETTHHCSATGAGGVSPLSGALWLSVPPLCCWQAMALGTSPSA